MVLTKDAPAKQGKVSGANDSLGTGRRKTSVARVRIRAGEGAITINGRPLAEYFPIEQDRRQVLTSLELTGRAANVDVVIRVIGGGPFRTIGCLQARNRPGAQGL